jgi:hypothetical protein
MSCALAIVRADQEAAVTAIVQRASELRPTPQMATPGIQVPTGAHVTLLPGDSANGFTYASLPDGEKDGFNRLM